MHRFYEMLDRVKKERKRTADAPHMDLPWMHTGMHTFFSSILVKRKAAHRIFKQRCQLNKQIVSSSLSHAHFIHTHTECDRNCNRSINIQSIIHTCAKEFARYDSYSLFFRIKSWKCRVFFYLFSVHTFFHIVFASSCCANYSFCIVFALIRVPESLIKMTWTHCLNGGNYELWVIVCGQTA